MIPEQRSLQAALADRYSIERELGRGGMATVYLARDLKHQRLVALKVLDPELAVVVGAERFLSEIRVTANLQHPNLLPLFDSGEADSLLYYVMPYVEGETLRHRMERERQLPVVDAVRIAVAVAHALAYAHDRGIIHRDLKPENILIQAGQPVVADFGIALAISNADLTRVTQTGLSLGTPQYMSPEQAMGERFVDGRTDVYALGCVLYEMLVGEPPFTGPTAQAIVARIMNDEPRSLTAQRRSIPPALEEAIHTALSKLPADRFLSMTEFATALSVHSRFSIARPSVSGAWDASGRVRRGLPWAVAATATACAILLAVRRAPATDPPTMRFALTPPDQNVGSLGGLALSKDGRTVVYGVTTDGVTRLARRSLDDPVSRTLVGTEGAEAVALSPDGRWVVFASTDAMLKKVPVEGGALTTLVATSRPNGIAWKPGVGPVLGMTAFSRTFNALTYVNERGDSVLHAVTKQYSLPAGSKPASDWAAADFFGKTGYWMEHDPVTLDDGKTVLFSHIGSRRTQLGVASLADGSSTILDFDLRRVIGVADGILLYLDGGSNLMGVRFDVRHRRIDGDPTRVRNVPGKIVDASVSSNGTLVMRVTTAEYQMVVLDERGEGAAVLPDSVHFAIPRFSPDGRRASFSADYRGTPAVWMYDFGTRSMTKLASSGADPRWVDWSVDGRRVISGFAEMGHADWLGGDEGTPETLRLPERIVVLSASLAPDGRSMAIGTGFGPTGFDIRVMRVGDSVSVPFAASGANEIAPRFSPDGKWIAYSSDESGRFEVYARPFPGPGPRVQLSDSGGEQPVWAKGGTRLFYRNDRAMMSVDLVAGPPGQTLAVSNRRRLFVGDFYNAPEFFGRFAAYDVSPDGQHFLIARAAGAASSGIVAWTSWLPEVKAALANRR